MSTVQFKSFTYRTNLTNVAGRLGELHGEGKPSLPVTSPPEFKGQGGIWTPEDLFVAAVEVCLMLTFIGIAEKAALRVASYESDAEGSLAWDAEQSSYRFVSVTVRPRVVVYDETSMTKARDVLDRAHRTCLVANSLRCEVRLDPTVTLHMAA